MRILFLFLIFILLLTGCKKENLPGPDPVIQNHNKSLKKRMITANSNFINDLNEPGFDPLTSDYNTYNFTINFSEFIYNSHEYIYNLNFNEGAVDNNSYLEIFVFDKSNSKKKLPYFDEFSQMYYSFSIINGGIQLSISTINLDSKRIKNSAYFPSLLNYEIHIVFKGDDWKSNS